MIRKVCFHFSNLRGNGGGMIFIRFFCIVLLLQLIADKAIASNGHSLRVEVPSGKNSPEIFVRGIATTPSFDSVSGKWSVPIDSAAPEFVIFYLISLSDKSAAPVRLGIPARIINSNQFVFISQTDIKNVDEVTIRRMWIDSPGTQSPSDLRVQFRFLQDLIYINSELMKSYGDNVSINAMRLRAAVMLFQVVRNVSEHTWYVVDPHGQVVIDYANKVISRAEKMSKSCEWISPVCRDRGVTKLLATVKSLNSSRFMRMYHALVPANTKLTVEFCDGGLSGDLRAFLDHLHSSNEDGGIQSISESRVVNEIASCETRLALCRSAAREDAIAKLDSIKKLLEKFRHPQTRLRLLEVERARQDLLNGSPASCPP